jgi:membrane protein implicated in regulation of membrane protease activity
VASILAVLFFFLLAMPTVGRARFSTPTMGRDYLIGRRGNARVDLTPDGVVDVDGAQWPATTHREAAIHAGEPVTVTGVVGWQLEVEPVREN